MSVEKIGKTTFDREEKLGKGRFGCVFRGSYGKHREVAIKRIDKSLSQVDSASYRKAEGHSNIIRFFCSYNKDVEFM